MVEAIRSDEPQPRSLEAEQYQHGPFNYSARQWVYDNCAVQKVNFYDEALQPIAVSQPKKVLDVGCFDGRRFVGAAMANGISATLVGLDPFEKSYTIFRDILPERQFSFVAGRAEQLPFADNSVDAITALAVLFHTDIDYALGELKRVVKPGGLIAISTNSSENKPRTGKVANLLSGARGALPKQPLATPFTSEKAVEMLPRYFEIITGEKEEKYFAKQETELRVYREQYDNYEFSLFSYIKGIDSVDALETIETEVRPFIMAEIDSNGYFSDQIRRYMFLLRNVK